MTATANAPTASEPIAQRDFSLMASSAVLMGMSGSETR